MRENEEENGREPRKVSQEEKRKLKDNTKLQNQELGVVDNIQRKKILTRNTYQKLTKQIKQNNPCYQ